MCYFKAVFLILFFTNILALDNRATQFRFIKDFLQNENKPTILVMHELCWSPYDKAALSRVVTAAGYRTSTLHKLNKDYQKHTLLFFIDLNCPSSNEDINKAASKGLFEMPYRWLVLYNKINDQHHPGYEALINTLLLSNSDLVLAEQFANSSYYMIEVFRASESHPMVTKERGWWNSSGFYDTRLHKELYRRRKNLMLKPLVMTNIVVDSNSTYENLATEDRTQVQYDSSVKSCWIIGKMGFQMLNATPLYMFSTDCGYEIGKGKWTGLVKDLLNKSADLGTSCYITHNRLGVIDFIDSLIPVKCRFIFRQPPLSYVSNIFMLPFSIGVWVATVVCAIVCALGLYLTSKMEYTYAKSNNIPDGSWADIFLLTMGAVCQQGSNVEPKKASGRIILLFLLIALMAVYAAYSANIVVLLQAPSDSIKTMQQLHDSKLTLGANDISYNHFWIKASNDTELHRSISRKISGKTGWQHFYKLEEGVEKIRQGMFAFHSMIEPVYRRIHSTFLESEKCDLVEIDYLNTLGLYQPTPKNHPQKELFQVVFKQIRESGLRAVNEIRYQVSKPKCSGSLVTFTSVGFTAFYPSLVFWAYGVALSLFLLVIEILIYRLTNRQMKTDV